MMNLDTASLSPALEAALEAHGAVLRNLDVVLAAEAAYEAAHKAHRALPAHTRLCREVCEAVEALDRAIAVGDALEVVLADACAKAGITRL